MNKDVLAGNKYNSGFSTIEMLMAFVVITLALTSVILVSFGNQSVAIDTEVANEALYIAEYELEEARADTVEDFFAIEDTFIPASGSELFDRRYEVEYVSGCTKQVTSEVLWDMGSRDDLAVALTSIFGSTEVAEDLGGDCEPGGATSNWDTPETYDSIDLSPSGNKGTDVDVIKRGPNTYALLTSEAASISKTDFHIVDATDAENLVILSDEDTEEHLNALDAFGDYAFVASASSTAQLQVIDISDVNNASWIYSSRRSLIGVDKDGVAPEAISIYYYDDRVYVGTQRTAGPELHVFDVSIPASPNHIGSLEINHNVHDIVVQNGYAYIASSADECELMVIDVSDPGSMVNPCPAPPIPAGATVFNADNVFDGTALHVLGSTVYLGRERATGGRDEFLILDARDLTAITSLGGENIDLNPNTEIVGIYVTSPLAFIVTTDSTAGFQVWNISEPSDIHPVSECSVYNYSEKATGLDFANNFVFVANESNDALRVIYDPLDQSCPLL